MPVATLQGSHEVSTGLLRSVVHSDAAKPKFSCGASLSASGNKIQLRSGLRRLCPVKWKMSTAVAIVVGHTVMYGCPPQVALLQQKDCSFIVDSDRTGDRVSQILLRVNSLYYDSSYIGHVPHTGYGRKCNISTAKHMPLRRCDTK